MEGPNLIIKEENIDLDNLVLVPNTQEHLEDNKYSQTWQ